MKPSVAAILKKSFADRAAIESLARRKERITSHSHEVWNEEHARAFTIAGLARLDILQEIRAGLERTLSGDLSRTEWESDVRALLKDAGLWTDKEGKRRSKADAGKFAPSRLRLIFDTNTASAYAAGRWTRLWERRETHPYLMYLTKQDERVRITHRRWHGLVLPIDHPFWQTHFPPNGFRCRCAVLGVTQAEYDRAHSGEETEIAGQRVHLDAPPEMTVAHVNRATGEIVQVPVGITPGFNYNPGMALSRERELAALVAQKTAGLDDAMLQAHVAATRTQPLSGSANTAPETAPAPQPVPVSELANITVTDNTNNKKARARHAPENGNETMRYLEQVASSSAHMGAQLADGFPEHVWEQIANEFSDFAQSVVETGRPQGRWVLVGTLRKNWVEKLQALDISLTTAEIAVSDDDVFHTWRDIKKNKLDWSWYLSLPLHLRRPSLVLLDRSGGAPSLLFVYQTEGNKIAVRYNYNVKSAGRTLNIARSGRRISEDDCKAMLADPSMVLIDENKEP